MLFVDVKALEPIVQDVLKEHTKAVDDYRNGKSGAIEFLVGQVMKRSRGQAPLGMIRSLLKEKLDSPR